MGRGVGIISRTEVSVGKPDHRGYPTDPKTLGEHIRRKRLDNKESQADVAKHFGVSKDCVWLWENGQSTPQLRHYPALIAYLDYYPFAHETESFGGKIRRYKNEHGMSNRKLAKLLGADTGTVSNWEQNRSIPTKKRMKYVLSVINKDTP